jgi:hypothetical protein
MVYKIIKEIKDALLDEPFVNTVTEGDIFEIDLNKATHQGNVLSFNITILLMDIINQKDDSNKVDIWNTQLLVATRVLNRLNRGDLRDVFFELTGNPTYEPFTERFENDLAGWAITFDVLVRNEVTVC